jgi:signal transduction histidine kinase
MMSHELRTPLNAIGGYAQLMELGLRGPTTEQQRADLTRIHTSQRHLLGLINSILNFARLEAGQVQFSISDVALGSVVQAARDLVEPQLRAKGLRSHWESCDVLPVGDGMAPVLIRADVEKVRQILLNLLSNAIKFTPAGGEVEVTCAVQGDHAVVRVRDTGRGIPADRLEHVFEPFVQVDRHLSPSHSEGVGLGLAISRDLAVRMGGELAAESTVDAGSTFTLTMPLATEASSVER